jgi:hypothetical protein
MFCKKTPVLNMPFPVGPFLKTDTPRWQRNMRVRLVFDIFYRIQLLYFGKTR